MKKRVYISGKISGLPREQYLKIFHKAEMELGKLGYWVVNPCRLLPCRRPWIYTTMERLFGSEGAYRLTLFYDIWHLAKCDLIYKVPGWKQSRGANVEGAFAYHSQIWQIPQKQRDKIDRRLAKYIDKLKSKEE